MVGPLFPIAGRGKHRCVGRIIASVSGPAPVLISKSSWGFDVHSRDVWVVEINDSFGVCMTDQAEEGSELLR